MRFLRRVAVFAGIALVILVTAAGIMKAQRARADAQFIAAANLKTITLTVGGLERRALVHLPPGAGDAMPRPVVLMFHGTGGTPEAVVRETGWVAKADAAGFIVVFPEATRPDPAQPPKFGRNNPAWNDGSGRFHAGDRDVPDVAFVAALLDELEARFAVDRRRVFATGFSNGASMAFRVGLELSGRFAAIAPVSGALWMAEPRAVHPVSLLYLTGTGDPINPMEGGAPKMASGSGFKDGPEKAKPPVREQVRKWVKLIAGALEPKRLTGTPQGITTEVYGGGRDGTEVIFTTIADQGHIWPGGRNLLPELIVGKATQHLNATEVVWDFFASHPKQNPPP